MGDEPYPDQLIGALRQLRTRVIEVRSENNEQVPREIWAELMRLHAPAKEIGKAWCNSREPPPPAYGASLTELMEHNSRARHATMQKLEWMTADLGIDKDFSVEAIDNAIRVVESQRDC